MTPDEWKIVLERQSAALKGEGVDFSGANLRGADLRGADLSGVNLRWAGLSCADLRGTDFSWANLAGADLSWANLAGADLSWANLRWANLRGADLDGANLRGADLSDAKLPEYQICPEEGAFIAWKAAWAILPGQRVVLKVEVPADAGRACSLVGRKIRASHVRVLEGEGDSLTAETPLHYAPGKIVRADSFDPDPRVECTQGIHIFMTRHEAEEWLQ